MISRIIQLIIGVGLILLARYLIVWHQGETSVGLWIWTSFTSVGSFLGGAYLTYDALEV